MFFEYLSLTGMSVFTAAGQILIKKGASGIPISGNIKEIIKAFISLPLICGLVLTLAAPVMYFYALRTLPLTKAYSFSALNYLFIFLASWFILREKPGKRQWVGGSLILLGLIVWNL